MVIGGYAVLYHAHARFTEDIDIVLGVDASHLKNILDAVSGKFSSRADDPKTFVEKTNVLPLLGIENEVRVDLIFSFLKFERTAIARSDNALVEQQTINIVRAEDLIVYKILAGRARDLDDVESILNHKKGKLNINEVTSNIKDLSIALADNSFIKKWKDIYSNFSD